MADFPSTIDLSSLGADGDSLGGGAAGDYAGWSVAGAGDVDGDGIDDVLIGAPSDGSGAGKVYVIFGKTGGIGAVDFGALSADRGFVIAGAALGDVAGWSVASAGDLDHDGLADIVVGARLADAGGAEDAGQAYVIFGRSGLAGPVDLAALAPGQGFAIASGAAFDHAGWSVGRAGDVNGDGIDDLLIGVPGADGAGADRGAAYVIFGHGGGFGDVDLLALGSQGFAIVGAADYDEVGRSVASAGDVNGDGFDDLIVGASHAGGYAGAAYVLFGHGGGFGTVDLGALAAADGFALIGADAEQAGFSVASAGDVNGDGFDDLIVGAPYAQDGAGRAYLVFGHAGPFAAVDLASLSGTEGFVIGGAAAGDHAGWSVAGGGDLNGDGFDDLMIGAPYADGDGGTDRGAAYVLFGHNGPFAPMNLGIIPSNQGLVIVGESDYDQAGRSVVFSGDINNDGLDDLLAGAPYSGAGDSGGAYIIYGKSGTMPAISLTTSGIAYTQDFNTLVNSGTGTTNNLTINGWTFNETGTSARVNGQYAVDNGGSTTGDTFSYGATGATDRALGQLRSGTIASVIGASFSNDTGATITSLLISYFGEQWRVGGTHSPTGDKLDFQISFDATSLTTGTWTDVNVLDFNAPTTAAAGAALDGNAAANRTSLSTTITGLTIANGATFWIRWVDVDASSSDDGLAIDDFSITPTTAAPPAETQTVQFSPISVTHDEGNSGTTAYTFTVTRTGGTLGVLNFSGTFANGGTDNADYVGGTAPTTFNGSIAAGQTSGTVTINVQGDFTIEGNENFTLTLTNVTNTDGTVTANIGANATGTGTITNDDAAGAISVDDVAIAEGDAGTTAGSFTVHRTGGATGTVTVDYLITLPGSPNADGSDVSGPLSGTVTFIEGQTTASIPFSINGDVTNEPNETFSVALSNVTGGATISDGNATATILNDDAPPTISIGDASLVEGDDGVTYLVFTVSLSKTSIDTVTVAYDTAGVTATEDNDYLGVSGQVSFAPGQTAQTISVPIIGDETLENNETLTVTLSGPTNATILDGSATGTITNDDTGGYYSLAGGSFSQDWTNTGQITANDNWNGVPYIIGYLGDIDAGTTAGIDPRTLTGPALGAIDVNAQIATTSTSGGVGEFELANPTIGLQGSGTADAPSIVLYMDATGRTDVRLQANLRDIDGTGDNTAQQINVQYRTSPGGAWINVPGGYFADVTTGPNLATQVTVLDVTLPAGANNAATLEIRIMTTNAPSNDEWVGIDDIVVSSQASGPVLSIANAAVFEGDSGPAVITFTVTRAGDSTGAVDADYAVNFGGGPFDANAADFTPLSPLSGNVHFDAGQTSAIITVSVNGDTGPEGDENFTVVLSNPTSGTIADGSATGTIVNDDGPPPLVTINDVTVTEGDAGTTLMTFTVTRTGGTGAFDVDFHTESGSATAPSDYVAASGTVHFADGQMTDTVTVAVTINGDMDSELSETLRVVLDNPTNFAIITDNTGIGTIASDDPIYIHDIQGTAYFSPILAGEGISSFNTQTAATVIVRAIVTAVDNDGPRQGFYLQEEITDWDGNSFTSEGIFVMTRNDAGVGTAVSGVAVGDLVTVTAHVMEYQGFSNNMPITALTNPSSIVVNSSGNGLPALLLDAGVPMPTAIMTLVQPDYTDSSDGAGDTFDASLYALSFWETVEGMLVTIPNMVVADGFVSTSGGQPIFQAYSQDHADADQINSRGGYTIAGDPPIGPPDTANTDDDTIAGGRHLSDGDVNPDIIEIDFSGFAIDAPAGLTASASMGDYLGSVTGIVEFDFTDRKLFVTDINPGSYVDHTTTQEITVYGDDSRSLTVATFNVENLDPGDGPARFAALAAAIANNLNMPDILSIEEMQDNNGATNDGTTDASTTWQMLVDALNTLTGAHYQWVDQAPANNLEGGEPGGNIRVGFLYNTDRVQLGDLDANATLAERRMYTDRIGDGLRDAGDLIQFSDDMLGAEINTADWSGTRKSLLGQFTFHGNTVFVTANHFPAKGGSDEFWQFNQNPATGEPTNGGWTGRNNVAQDVYSMLNLIETNAPGSGIVSGGDYNDFYFYRPLTTVTGYTMADGTARVGGARFDNLTLMLSEAERYTYNFDGRSQAIDHIIVNGTLSAVASYDVVHINTGFNTTDPTPLSDHDPGLSSFNFRNFSETLVATAGNDAINGFGGTDTIVYAGPRSDYTVIAATDANGVVTGFTSVTDNNPGNGDEGSDTLTSIERLQFADTALDLGQRVQLFDGSGNLVGTFNDIQDAIDAASDGYRIEAQAGTYNESLNVDVDVTIEGANQGIAGTGARGAETLITGQVVIAADGVTINGVAISGAGAGALGTTGIVVQGGADSFSLVNSVLNGSGDLGMIVGLVTGLDVGHNLIEGYATGMYVAGGETAGSVHDNRFQGNGPGSGTGLVDGLNSETTHVTISGNIFDGIDGGSLFLFPSGPDSVDLDSYIIGNTITNSGADRPVQILPTNLTHNVIGTDYNEAFDGETAAANGVTGAFSYDGQGGDDRAWGGGAGDTFTGGAGDEFLYGNGGSDTAVYAGNRSDYTITFGAGSFLTVTDNVAGNGDEGSDTLDSIEVLRFADVTLDLGQRVQLYDGGNNLVGTFDTIQDAIDAASNGYRIEARAGTYNESLNVDVDVTIEGANAGTAGTASRGAETIITGNVTIAAAGVTIDGVEITGAAADALGTTGIVVQGGANNFSLVNSVLNGSGDLGMIVGLVTGLDVGHNLIEGYATGMYVAGGGTTGSVHDNRFQGDGPTNGTGLINGLQSETTHVTISGNAFDALDGGSLFLFPSGPDSVDLDSYIIGNTITNSGADRPVQILPTNLTHNVIGTDYNEAFDGETAAANGVTGAFSYDGQGGDDRAWGGGADDTFTGGAGNEFLYGNGGSDTAAFAGNRADYTVVTVTDANGVVTGFTSVTDNVAAGLDEGTDTLDSIEQLQFADVTLNLADRVQLFDGSGNLVGTFNDIQAAIDAASNGYRIEAQAGTYNESLNVDVDITIEGANAGTAGTASRGAETIITGNVTIAAAGVTIDGVEITGAAADALGTTGIVVQGGANNFSLVNSVLNGTGDLGMIVGLVTGLDVGHNLIEGYATGMYVAGGGTTGSVHDNRFQGDGPTNGTGLINGLQSETTHVTISGNAFDALDGGSLFLFPSGPDSVDLDSYISGNTITNSGADRPVQILPTNLTHNVIGTDYNEAFDGETAAGAGVTGAFSFDGQGGDDRAWGGGAGDTFTGGAGNEFLYGNGGSDTAVYAGNRADYTIVTTTDSNGVVTGFTSVTDNVAAGLDEGTDTLDSIERLQFADVTLDVGQRVQLFNGGGTLVGTFDNIQDAIDAASNGYRIEAQAGTYNESLTVDVDVTIEGANAGTAGTASRGPETIITGQVTVSVAGVTIDGVEITGSGAGALGTTGVVVDGGANNFSLVNSVLNGTGDLGMIVGLVTGLDVGGNLIEGYSIGMYVAGGETAGSIHDNLFQGDGGPLTGLGNGVNSETTHVTISDNVFDGIYGGSLNLFPSGPDSVDLDSYISGNTISDSGADRPVQILPTNLTHNVIGTDYNEAFDGETAAGAGVTGAFSFDGQGGDDRAWGGGEADTFTGGAGDDQLYGNGGNDNFTGGTGNDILFGNAGDDNAFYSGNRSDYTVILLSPGVIQITDDRPGSPDGTDQLEGVERIVFANNDYWVEANGTLSVINDAPLGIDHTLIVDEDVPHVFTVADFSFTEVDPSEANQLLEVTIVDLPAQGTIYYDADGAGPGSAVAISAGDTFTAADLNAGRLTYVTDLNENGVNYATFTYQVRDDGGTAHGGADTDPTPNTITIDANPVNDAPSGTDNTITFLEDGSHTLTVADFGYSDPVEGDDFTGVLITNLLGGGTLLLDGNPVTAGQFISADDIDAGLLVFVPAHNENGLSYASFDFQVRDDGGTDHGGLDTDQSADTITFNVTPVNDEPTLTATPTNPSYVEDSIRVDLFNAVSASTVEPGQTITGMTLTVTNVTDGAFELLRFDGSNVALTNGNSVFTDVNGLTVTVSLSGTTATVTFSGASLTEGELATLVDTVAYFNGSQKPTDADRVVTITQLTDSGADIAPDDNVSNPSLVSTVNVEPVNDAPTSTLLANDTRTYFEGNAPVTLDVLGNATIADVDSANFDGGSLTLSFGASPLAEDNLLIINNANVTTAGNVVSVNGTAIGTFSGGSAGTNLVFAFNTDATPAAVQLLVRTIGYTNSGGDTPTGGLRTIGWTFNDGDGNANGGTPTLALNTKVNVIPVNDAPDSADNTIAIDEDQTYHFSASDFAFSDVDGNTLAAVRIDSLPTSGTLFFDPDGAGPNPPFAVSPGVSFSIASIDNLYYVPDPDSNGLDSFLFAVVDSGGAADATPNTMTLDVAAVNDGPSVDINPGGGFQTDEQVPLDLKGTISIDDIDSDNGTITVTLSVDYGILTVTAGGSGADVADSGTGTVTITGTLAEIQALLGSDATSSVSYTPDTDDPPASAELSVTIDDEGNTGSPGNLTANATETIAISAINDAPTLTATATDPTFTEDGAAVDLFGTVSASTIEAGQTLTSLTLTVTNVTDGADEVLSIDGSAVALTNGNSVVTATNGLTVNVSVAAGVATVSFSGAALSEAQLATLVDGLAYSNTSQDPTDADRVVTITELVDSGANGAPDDNVSAPNLGSTVDVEPVNDAANITGDTAGDVTEAGGVNNGTAGTPTDSGDLAATDPDNTNDAWQAVSAGAATANGYGTYALSVSGVWTYTLDDGNAAVQALNGAATLTDSFTALTEDGTAQLVTITIHAQDDAPVARPDAVTTNEATILNGNVTANNGSGADSDVDGPALTVTAVNGSANVGTQITLASGAKLTVNADGTFSYDPNHAFDATPAPGSGASNQPAADSFTYTLSGGGTATVSVTVTGLDSNDELFGTAGADTLSGGAGNDLYHVNNAGDQIVEAVGGGNDYVVSSVSYALNAGAEVELISTSSNAGTAAINLTGNEFANILVGNAGANVLDGGSGGADLLQGLGGNDTYYVDADDRVFENAGGGSDYVVARSSYALEAGASVELMSTSNNAGTAAINLTGNELSQVLVGNAGANVLDGGSGGADTLQGLGGNDTYFVDADDSVYEDAGGGFDYVVARSSYALGAGASIELVSTSNNAGTASINLTGNELSQVLVGNAGANVLDAGSGGADTLQGLGGNDTYFVDGNDQVLEDAGGGFDYVVARASYTLAAGVSVELMSTDNNAGIAAIDLTGNDLANILVGNAGANLLNGGLGADTLHGLGGADTFAFTTALGGGNVDAIVDFVHGTDRIALDDAVFTAIGGPGALNANAFFAGTAAHDADDRIVYDQATGNLYYDADGNGAGAAVLFATLQGLPTLTATDFTVI